MLDIEQLEALENQVSQDAELKTFVEESLSSTTLSSSDIRGDEATVTRFGVEIAALWSLGLATLLVLRRLGLFGGSRKSQAADTGEAARKIAEAVETLTDSGFSKEQAIAAVNAMYEHAAERRENSSLIKSLIGA